MPGIFRYECNKCAFSFEYAGWGGNMYVLSDEGERVVCAHPGEFTTVGEVLGLPYDSSWDEVWDEVLSKVGFHSDCVCIDCFKQFRLDLGERIPVGGYPSDPSEPIEGRDERKCPRCGSLRVKAANELVEQPCPKCEAGKIEKIWTGWVT
jgi:hypothetical protein